MIREIMAIISASGSKLNPLYNGLISAYNFDTNANDQRGSNNGTLVNSPVSISGKIGNAYSFDGTNYITMGNTLDVDGSSPFSMSIWVKNSYAGTNAQAFISKIDSSTPYNGYYLGFNGVSASGPDVGKICFLFIDQFTNIISAQTTATFNDGSWHHIVCTYDGSKTAVGILIYLDGVLQSTTSDFSPSMTGSSANAINFEVAARNGNRNAFIGSIDIIKAWSRSLTSGDVTSDYNSGSGRQYPT